MRNLSPHTHTHHPHTHTPTHPHSSMVCHLRAAMYQPHRFPHRPRRRRSSSHFRPTFLRKTNNTSPQPPSTQHQPTVISTPVTVSHPSEHFHPIPLTDNTFQTSQLFRRFSPPKSPPLGTPQNQNLFPPDETVYDVWITSVLITSLRTGRYRRRYDPTLLTFVLTFGHFWTLFKILPPRLVLCRCDPAERRLEHLSSLHNGCYPDNAIYALGYTVSSVAALGDSHVSCGWHRHGDSSRGDSRLVARGEGGGWGNAPAAVSFCGRCWRRRTLGLVTRGGVRRADCPLCGWCVRVWWWCWSRYRAVGAWCAGDTGRKAGETFGGLAACRCRLRVCFAARCDAVRGGSLRRGGCRGGGLPWGCARRFVRRDVSVCNSV